MTKYVAEILKRLNINYEDYRIENHWDDESGDTWITLHPKFDWREESNIKNRLTKLGQCTWGSYKIYWDEDSCYLNIIGKLEINSNGTQVFPLPTNDSPALFSKEFILKTWEENKDYVPDPSSSEDYETDEADEEDVVTDNIVKERYFVAQDHFEDKKSNSIPFYDDEYEEGGRPSKNGSLGRKRGGTLV